MSSITATTGSTLGTLAREEVRNYLHAKLFWFGAGLVLVLDALMLFDLTGDPGSSGAYMIIPGALLGILGVAIMFGLTRRSDLAAEAAGAVAVPERTRTLALAAATVVPFSVALFSFVVAVLAWNLYPPAGYLVPPGIPGAYVYAQMFGDGVMCAVGGPLLGLLLARYVPKRGVAAVASVLLVIATMLLQGGLVGGDQRYRVFWFWTYFITQRSEVDGIHMGTYPGNPLIWVVYLIVLCTLGIVAAVYHDPDADRPRLMRLGLAGVGAAIVLGILSMTVGYSQPVTSPGICELC